jgi:hypothetical protein
MRLFLLSVSLSGIGLFGCDASRDSAPAPPAPPFNAAANVKQLMNWIIDPGAQAIWASVGTIVDEHGAQEFAPESDDEWTRIHNSAAMVAESGNLLMMEGRARNAADWMMKSRRLIDTANEARKAALAKDADALFAAGGDLYQACADCHAQYMLEMNK